MASPDSLQEQIAALRQEIAAISDSVNDYGSHTFRGARQNAMALTREMRHQGEIVARQVGRRAGTVGRAVQDNPVPAIVALGTIALLSALIFTRD